MKIGVVLDNDYQHDPRVKREVKILKLLGYEVFLLCLTHDPAYNYAEEGLTIRPILIRKKWKNTMYFFMNLFPFYEWWWAGQVSDFIRDFKLDVVHTHDLYMSKGVKEGVRKSGSNIPMILDLHENYPHAVQSYRWTQGFLRSLLARPKRWLSKEARYLKYADRIIVLSEDFKAELLSRFSFLKPDNLLVFPNVVDTEEFRSYDIRELEPDELPARPRLLYFGAVAHRRGIFRTLNSCKELLRRGVHFSIVIIGPVDAADKAAFFEQISDPIFQGKLIHLSWIHVSDLPTYMNACDIALAPFDVNPQHESGVANKIFQYMYGRLPIVASACKPQKEIIEKFEMGLIFDSDEGLTEKLQVLIDDIKLAHEMGQRGYNALLNHFDQERFIPAFRNLIEDVRNSSAI